MTPAAVLSIMVKAQGISDVNSDLRGVDSTAKKTGGSLSKVAKVAGVGLAAGFGAGALAVKGLVKAASESQVSNTKMQAQLKALGISYSAHAKDIDKVIQKHSALAGVDDEDLQDAFTAIVRSTGDVSTAMKDMNLVTDLARAKNINVAKAGELLAKVHAGNTGVLKRMGIAFEPVTEAQDKLKASGEKYTKMQLRAAKANDKTATSQDALAQLQRRFSGQAEAYGKTAAGAQERFGVAVENLQETLGAKLLPVFTKVANAVADFVNGMQTGEGVGGTFVATLKSIVTAFQDVWTWAEKNKTVLADIGIVVGIAALAFGVYRGAQLAAAAATTIWTAAQVALNAVMTANPITLIVVGLAALAAGLVLAYKHSETFRNIVNGAFAAIKAVAVPVVEWLSHAIPDAWNWIKTATINMWGWAGPYLKAAFEVIKVAVTTYFKVYWTIIQGVWTAIRAATTTLWGWFGPYIKAVWEGVKTATGIYFNAIKTVISGAWTAIQAAAKVAWALIKATIVDPIRETKKAIGDIWDGIKSAADKAWDKLTSAAGTFATGLKDKITDAFRDAANLVLGFVNKIIDVVNKIPGVNITKLQPFADTSAGKGPNGLARGGAFGRTGGMVRSPITLMGEEAPRYPEYVIPTNPAYRGRARGLLAQAAGSIGFATGGVWSKGDLKNLWERVNPGLGDSNLMAAIALAESSGNQNAHNPSGASGLWQILGLPFPGNPFDPSTNARMAGSKLRSQGLGAWEVYTTGAYKQFLGKGFLGKVGDALSGAFDVLKNGASALLGGLPGAGGLGWLKGLGSHVLGKVGEWIKDKATGIFSGGGGGSASGLSDAVQAALGFARGHGWGGSVVSGFRSRAQQEILYAKYLAGTGNKAAPPGSSMHERGLAVDVSDPEAFARAMGMMGAGALMRKVAGEPWHFSTTGYARGGILGSYKNGTPFVPQTGLYKLHRGESVIPYAAGGVLKGKTVPLPPAPKLTPIQQAIYLKQLQDFIKRQAPPAKGLPMGSEPAVVVAAVEPAAAVELTTAIDNNTQALEDQRKQWDALIAADYQSKYNVSQSQYQVLSDALWEAAGRSGGGRFGLAMSGLRAPAGAVGRL